MDPGNISSPYHDFNLQENYWEAPDLTRRLPVENNYYPYPYQENFSQQQSPQSYSSYEDVTVKRYIGSGIAYVSLITENLLSHPFLVLRRQCQVNHASKRYHLLPVTLLPIVRDLQQHQGLTTLWKGLGSVLLVRGMSLGIEDLISKLTPWPRETNTHSSLKQFLQHTMLKCVTFAIVTPFYSASFVETVQSDITSEAPGILDVFREGFVRLLNWGAPANGRMLPVWALILPTITLGLAKFIFSFIVKKLVVKIMNILQISNWEKTGTIPKDSNAVMEDINLMTSLIATVASDITFYPCETIVHRLYLQGTRTIIDDLSNGQSVLPILTNYSGAIDCFKMCIATEGTAGLYKGFGALILQYMGHIALIKLSRFVLSEVGDLLKKPAPKPQISMNSSPPAISNLTNPPKSYLLP